MPIGTRQASCTLESRGPVELLADPIVGREQPQHGWYSHVVGARLGARAVKARGSSRFVGVHWDTAVGRWSANITDSGPPLRSVRVGHFDREEDAAIAWDRVVLHERGGSAKRNFPDRSLAPASPEEIRREARRLRKLRMASQWIGVHPLRKSARFHSTRPWYAQVRLTSGRLLIQSGVPPALPGRQPPFDISRG